MMNTENQDYRIEYHGKGILDSDLAKIYGVSTMRLNEQYQRNKDLFESNWVVQLTENEEPYLRCQSGATTVSSMSRSLPLAFNREASNGMAFQLPQSPIARKRSKVILKTFSDLERMARGEDPKQPDLPKPELRKLYL